MIRLILVVASCKRMYKEHNFLATVKWSLFKISIPAFQNESLLPVSTKVDTVCRVPVPVRVPVMFWLTCLLPLLGSRFRVCSDTSEGCGRFETGQ